MLQVFGVIGETLVTRPFVDHITGETHVSEADLLACQLSLQIGFYPRIVLHAIRQTVSIHRNNVVRSEREWFGCV